MKRDKFKYIFNIILIILASLIFFTYDTIQTYRENLRLYRELHSYIFSANNPELRSNGTSFIGTTFCDFTLEDIKGHSWRLQEIQSTLKVIILFSTDDCSQCLLEYRLWKEIDKRYQDREVMIFGISHDELVDILSFAEEKEIQFPILHDVDSVVKKEMGFRFSPLRVILDKQNRIINVARTSPGLEEHKEVLKKLEDFLKISE